MSSILKLKELLELGFITDEEFQRRLESLEAEQLNEIPDFVPSESSQSYSEPEMVSLKNEYASKPDFPKLKAIQDANVKIGTVRVFISSTFVDMQVFNFQFVEKRFQSFTKMIFRKNDLY